MKKSIFRTLLLLALTLSLTFCLFACGDDPDGDDGIVKDDEGEGGYHLCSYTTFVEREEPTCEEYGHEVYRCECGDTVTNDIEPLGHDYGEWEITDAPDLYNQGWISKVCSRNEEHYESELVPQLDPDNTNYTIEVTEAATLTEPGEAIYKITINGKEFSIEGVYLHPCYSTVLSLVGATNVNFNAYYAEDGEIGESFTVPGTYGDYTVTHAGFREFDGLKTLTVASPSTGITCYGCTSLETVILPAGYTEIDNGAFEGCTSLSNINIPSSVVTIGSRAFAYCSSLESISLGSGITEIGGGAFTQSGLTELILPESLTEVSTGIASWCEALESVVIPEGVTSIGANAFNNCAALTEVSLPSTLESIGGSVFYGCDKVTEVNYGGSINDWCAISLYNSGSTPMQSGKASFSAAEGSFYKTNTYYVTGALGHPTQINHSFLIIPDGVETIGNYQFYGFSIANPVTVIIEGDVTSIGEYAFGGCDIQHIVISSAVTSIDENAFRGATLYNSSEIYFNGSATDYAASALKDIADLSDCEVYYYGTDWRYNIDGNIEVSVDGGLSWYLEEALSPYYNEEYPE